MSKYVLWGRSPKAAEEDSPQLNGWWIIAETDSPAELFTEKVAADLEWNVTKITQEISLEVSIQ